MADKNQNESESPTAQLPAQLPEYVTELNGNDVLLGRGAPILNSKGNVRFRKLVQEHKAVYTSTGRHAVKDEIARRIIHTITAMGGRFLRRIETQTERNSLQVPENVVNAWVTVDQSVKLSKVKQALREQVSKPGEGAARKIRKRKSPIPRDDTLKLTSRPLPFPLGTVSGLYPGALGNLPGAFPQQPPPSGMPPFDRGNLDTLALLQRVQAEERLRQSLLNSPSLRELLAGNPRSQPPLPFPPETLPMPAGVHQPPRYLTNTASPNPPYSRDLAGFLSTTRVESAPVNPIMEQYLIQQQQQQSSEGRKEKQQDGSSPEEDKKPKAVEENP